METLSAPQKFIRREHLHGHRRDKRTVRRGECSVPGIKQLLRHDPSDEVRPQRGDKAQPLPTGPGRAFQGSGELERLMCKCRHSASGLYRAAEALVCVHYEERFHLPTLERGFERRPCEAHACIHDDAAAGPRDHRIQVELGKLRKVFRQLGDSK